MATHDQPRGTRQRAGWPPSDRWTSRGSSLGRACDKFGGISGESRSCPKGSNDGRCDRWRIFASLCVTLWTEKTPKSPLFEPFLAENRWSKRQSSEKASRRKGLHRVYRCYKSVALWRILSTPVSHPKFAEIRKFVRSPPLAARRFAVTDSHGRLDHPKISLIIKGLTSG
jgi:hypothetical protein